MTTASGNNAVIEIVTKGPKGDPGFPAGGVTGQVLAKASNDDYDGEWITVGGTGTVTSVDLDAPTGFAVAGGPITTAGTITLSYASGYQGFTTAEASKLAGIEAGAQVNVATNLAYEVATRLLSSSTGTDVTLPLFTSTLAGLTPASGGGTTNFLRADGTWAEPPGGSGGSGTVTSVGFTAPTGFSVTGSPITTSGTIELSYAAGYQGYTSTEASKLAGIATGAEVNVNADWNATSGDAQILNKPTLGGAAALDVGTTSSTVATGDRGLPTGGTTGQVLQKTSGTDYDADWETLTTRTTSANGLQPALSFAAITYGATVDLDLAALDGQYRTITLTGDITFTTSNRAAGRTVVIRLLPGASERTLTFPADWVFVSTKPATLAANKTAVLSLTFFGTADTDCVAAYGVQP